MQAVARKKIAARAWERALAMEEYGGAAAAQATPERGWGPSALLGAGNGTHWERG